LIHHLRKKHFEKWVGGYLQHLVRQRAERRTVESPRHLLFAFCDHFEPLWRSADRSWGEERVKVWEERYPLMADRFRDADGRPPRHSFFFPGEQYVPSYLERLGRLVKKGYGEVELHLHHDGDTAEKLRNDLLIFLDKYASHGHLSRDSDGRLRYAFIHGNWCLANSRADGRFCGVDSELPLLFETGCYADYTFPAAPDEAQPNIVNQIYWPEGALEKRRAYEKGVRAKVGVVRRDRILLIEGPLALTRRHDGRLPMRIENAAITAADPATPDRIRSWVEQGICIEGRPDWVFVKVHTHGAPDRQAAGVLGSGSRALHEELTTRYNDGHNWRLHYVTAREMFNIAMAAMEGKSGDPAQYRDHLLRPPPAAG
jgi:hypothetical protein